MTYYCHPSWFKIATQVKDEFGDRVIELYLKYYRNYSKTLEEMVTKQRSNLDLTYGDYIRSRQLVQRVNWREVITFETMKNPSLLKEKGNLRLYEFDIDGKLYTPETSFYNFIFMVAFISFVYDNMDYYDNRDSCAIMQEEIQAIIKEIFDEINIDIYISTPFANEEMYSILLKAYQGIGNAKPRLDEWTYYSNQFKEYPEGVEVLENMMDKFAPLWELKPKILLMNWKQPPF